VVGARVPEAVDLDAGIAIRGGAVAYFVEAELGLEVLGEGFVAEIEVAVALGAVADAGGGVADDGWRRRRRRVELRLFDDFDDVVFGDAHVVEAVFFVEEGVVEPGAVACFPRGAAFYAKLRLAAAIGLLSWALVKRRREG